MDSPGSPLSELSSDDFQEETRVSVRSMSADPFRDHENDGDSIRPSKRPRLGANSAWENIPPPPSDADISSDTEGSVPGSPHPFGAGDDEDGGPGGREQVTACKWDGCAAGDLGNMDLLVQHLHEEHIHARQKKYSCEWADCSRKGIPHASGYALRAHMRSHTREKPFYCSLPECDRSFTRSDALAKHMRTVHETEALRPSDPVPKHHSSNPQNKAQRIRLTLKGLAPAPAPSNGDNMAAAKDPLSAIKSNPSNPVSPSIPPLASALDTDYDHHNVTYAGGPAPEDWTPHFPPDVHFSAAELALPPSELLRLLRRQLHWAAGDAEALRRDVEARDRARRDEWVAKELVLENLLEAEMATAERRRARKGARPASYEEEEARLKMRADVAPAKRLQLVAGEEGGLPWWRERDGAKGGSEGLPILGEREGEASGPA